MFEKKWLLYELHLEQQGFASPIRMETSWPKPEINAVSNLLVHKLPEDTTIGIHGTSLHAIRVMLSKGYLPAGAVKGDFTEGCIYFEPRAAAIRRNDPNILPERLHEFEGWQEEYQGYSESLTRINAQKHALLYFLGLDFSDKKNHDLVLDTLETANSSEMDKALAALEKRGVDPTLLALALSCSKDFCGVLIGLNARALKDFKLTSNPDTLEAPRLIAPHGITDKYFTGILPLGKIEKEFFRRLKRL